MPFNSGQGEALSSSSTAPPPAKCARYFEHIDLETDSGDEDEETNKNPESYYGTTTVEMALEVNSFMNNTFRRCIPKSQRLAIAKEYLKPTANVAKVPKIDSDIKGALGKRVFS